MLVLYYYTECYEEGTIISILTSKEIEAQGKSAIFPRSHNE